MLSRLLQLISAWRLRRASAHPLLEAAESLGWKVNPRVVRRTNEIVGSVGEVRIKIQAGAFKNSGSAAVCSLRAIAMSADSPSIPRDVVIRPADEEEALRDHLTGDGPFDHAFRVVGPQAQCLGMLGAEQRAWMLQAAAAVRGGELIVPVTRPMNAERIGGAARSMAKCYDQLSARAAHAAESLLDSVRTDSDPRVRVSSLLCLHSYAAGTATAQEAIEAAMADPHPAVRLEGAALAGDGGLHLLRSLAVDRDLAMEPRLRALRMLLSHPFDGWAELTAEILELEPEYRARALEVQELTDRRDVRTVMEEWVRQRRFSASDLKTLARILGEFMEPYALAMLDESSEAVQRAAVSALARCGTAAAVEPLQQIERSKDRGKELRGAAEMALQRIRNRLVGAEAGWVSLAGELSQSGALSEPEHLGALQFPPAEPRDDGAEEVL